jgi:hypothetical protein
MCLVIERSSNLISLRMSKVGSGAGEGNAVSVGFPKGCETQRLTDGGEVSLTRRPHFTLTKLPSTHFY